MKHAITILALLLWVAGLSASIRALEKNGSNLTVEYILDSYELRDAEDFLELHIEGANYPTESGAPSLPSLEFKIGIPPFGDASYTVLSTTTKDITLEKRLQPVPYLENAGVGSAYRYEVDEGLYRAANEPLLKGLGTHLFRSHPFMPIVINPAQYDGQYRLTLTTSALIRISIQGNLESKSPPATDPMSQMILDQLINAEDARYWQEQQRANINYADFARSPWWLRVETDKQGMYRLNPSHLSGFTTSEIDPRSFRLFTSTGKPLPYMANSPGNEFMEVPIRVIGEEDGSFDSGDYIVFYGSNRRGWNQNNSIQYHQNHLYHNPYSNNNVYWLTFAGDFEGNPQRMTNAAASNWNTEHSTHLEEIHVEQEVQRREQIGYIWYMTRMFGSSTMDYNFDVDLPSLQEGTSNNLSFRIRQEDVESGVTHSINVWVNDILVQSNGQDTSVHRWTGNAAYDFNRNTSAFRAGSNRIKIRVNRNNTPHNLFLDYYRITYQKKLEKGSSQYAVNAYPTETVNYNFSGSATGLSVYKVRDDYRVSIQAHQSSSSGFSFASEGENKLRFYVCKPDELYNPAKVQKLNPVDLTDIDSPIQCLIVSPAEFAEKAEELAQMYQQNWGYSSKIALQEDIFDQFTGGHPDPAAIRQYVRYIYHNAPQPKIQSLTLLGLGSLDWRNYSGEAINQNRIMIYQHPTNPLANVSDDYFAMITSNTYPEVAVGRYPVSNTSELNNMLNNFRRYTQNPKPGLWRNSMVFLADDFINGPNTYEYVHTFDMQELALLMNPAVYNAKIFAEEYDYDQFLNKPKVRDELFTQINLGKLIFYYVGHGSFDALGMQNYFTGATDMGRFQNPDMLPLFVAASCEVSAFDHWAYESLGQKSVLSDNRGAIASVGATRKSYSVPNQALMIPFMANMVNKRNPLGYSLINAKLRYTQSGINDEMYVIMGDPNLHIVPPERDSTMILNASEDQGRPTVHSREIAHLQGTFSDSGLQGEAILNAFDAQYEYDIRSFDVSRAGTRIFTGSVSVEDSAFNGGFFVPDDILSGDTGLVTAYLWDETSKKDYLAYYYPLALSDEVLPGAPENDGAPEISLFLSSYDFREGDTVSTSPNLYAKISDGNGINITGSAGHNILLVIDDSSQPIPVTEYFNYDKDSFSSGTLIYPIQNLSEGPHTLQVIAFDNFNLPAVQTTSFVAHKTSAISLENLLIYPNPIKIDGHVTFLISESADIILDIFTMSGRRIRRIETNVQPGFNKIPFDSRDQFGDILANNTYFIRVRAKTANGDTVEKSERLVIYK